jgi:hypothetical protein
LRQPERLQTRAEQSEGSEAIESQAHLWLLQAVMYSEWYRKLCRKSVGTLVVSAKLTAKSV